ncbi:hypothetical protein NP493_49g02028 [Ridgeia piscesae]|uniref:Dendritic cell-specific transmembrane protein-like domain-containing protein n=1 Tax=Ridgeia piscesae TaxID=27915 RepID=A0AAD9PB81_RIDPI|nr:hypothetical protein NP493_49g02028 [Ridgeia piscesae]
MVDRQHYKAITVSFTEAFPAITRFLTSRPEEFKMLKVLLGCPFGFLIATAIYLGPVDRMDLPPIVRYILGGVMAVMLTVGFGLSVQVRCATFLSVPTVVSKVGRAYVITFAVAYLLTGPVVNIIHNAKQVADSFGCSANLLHNQTLNRMELLTRPLQDIMGDLEKEAKISKQTSEKIRQEFSAVKREVEDEGEIAAIRDRNYDVDKYNRRNYMIDRRYNRNHPQKSVRAEHRYERKLDYRCEDVFNYGITRCKHSFNSIHRACRRKLPAGVNKVCSLLKFGIFCNLIKLVPTVTGLNCDARTAVNQGFGESFETANEAQEKFNENFKVEANYKMISIDEPLELKTGEDVAKGLTYQFNRRREWLDLAVLIVNRLMAFMFLMVIFSAYSYQKNYLTRIEFDNIYMTAYFRRIDARRYAQQKLTLLPLKKIERSELQHPFSPTYTKAEIKKLMSSTLQTFVRAFIFGMIIFVDHVIFSVLDILARNSEITYSQIGQHSIGMLVTGSGVISRLMSSFLGSFNKQHHIDVMTSNKECLPVPTATPTSTVYNIFSVLAIVWLMALAEAYALRLRRAICAFFYRKPGCSDRGCYVVCVVISQAVVTGAFYVVCVGISQAVVTAAVTSSALTSARL